jgi:hypothetical protein
MDTINIAQCIATSKVATDTFGEVISNIINRELKYCKPNARIVADGSAAVVHTFNTDWLKNVDERIAVQFGLANVLWKNGMLNEDGTSKLFTPFTVPFHLSEDGTPQTQLRVFFYRPASSETVKYPQSTIMVRCEQYGLEARFDRDSAYSATANAPAVAE